MGSILYVSQNARAEIAAHPYARRIAIDHRRDWLTGPRGFALCRWCGEEVPNKRRCYCDDDCVHEFMLRSDPGYVRRCVHRRDHGKCSACSLDTDEVKTMIFKAKPVFTYKQFQIHTWKVMDEKHREECLRFIQMGFPHPYEAWWQADHILPVIEGGGLCGLENYRTLCIPCHKLETKALAGRRTGKLNNHPLLTLAPRCGEKIPTLSVSKSTSKRKG